MVRLDWRDRLQALPSQTPRLVACLGLTRDEVDASAWAVLPDGRLRPGAAAVLAGVDQLLPWGVPVFGTAGAMPGLRQLTEGLYRLVARNRHRLPGTADSSIAPPAGLDGATEAELARRALGRRVA
jgi:predicted DCC family thiol-disulfide oxidoreductase YuxK